MNLEAEPTFSEWALVMNGRFRREAIYPTGRTVSQVKFIGGISLGLIRTTERDGNYSRHFSEVDPHVASAAFAGVNSSESAWVTQTDQDKQFGVSIYVNPGEKPLSIYMNTTRGLLVEGRQLPGDEDILVRSDYDRSGRLVSVDLLSNIAEYDLQAVVANSEVLDKEISFEGHTVKVHKIEDSLTLDMPAGRLNLPLGIDMGWYAANIKNLNVDLPVFFQMSRVNFEPVGREII